MSTRTVHHVVTAFDDDYGEPTSPEAGRMTIDAYDDGSAYLLFEPREGPARVLYLDPCQAAGLLLARALTIDAPLPDYEPAPRHRSD